MIKYVKVIKKFNYEIYYIIYDVMLNLKNGGDKIIFIL